MPMTRRGFFKTALPNYQHHIDQQIGRGKPLPSIGITPNTAFFRQYARTPVIDAASWGLSIGGTVRNPLSLSYADLLALPAARMVCTLVCAANAPGGERIGNVRWRGVKLDTLLDEFEIDASARFARLEAADGHITSIPLERLRDSLLSYAMNGEMLTPEQGFPARLIVPGLYDYKSPRWIERIELTDLPVVGDWEARGWPMDGTIRTTCGITEPRAMQVVSSPIRLEGYAFAGMRAVAAVEISIDSGEWMLVPFSPAPPNMWTRWAIDWPAPAIGDYQVRVRAWDGHHYTKPDDTIHAITVRVGEA